MEAAFFDLDKTVIARASMVAFGRPLYREGLLSRWLLLRALYGQLVYLYLGADEGRMAKMRESVTHLTRGWDQQTIRRIVRDTLTEVIDPIVYDEALTLIRDHRAAGRLVYIVSASPEEIVEPLTEYLGADGFIATRSRLDERGRYAGEIEFYAYGPHKAEAMVELAAREGIDLAASYAYSDSATDIPMLEVVGHAVAVNPDRDLARAASEQGWEVRYFTHDVRLRDRVSMPKRAQTAAVGGGLATIAAAAAAWWWLRRDPPPLPPSGRWARATSALQRKGGAAAAGLSARRRGPSWPQQPRAQQGRGGATASSWLSTLTAPARSRARSRPAGPPVDGRP
jgi:HAD superfamily hydrolase (TIGR01490 family)